MNFFIYIFFHNSMLNISDIPINVKITIDMFNKQIFHIDKIN